MTSDAESIVELLPPALGGELGLQVLDASGRVIAVAGCADGTEVVAADDGRPLVRPPRGRSYFVSPVASDGGQVVLTFPEARRPGLVPFFESLFGLIEGRRRLEHDLESMFPSALALMEETSMWDEVLPTLPTGHSEEEVAEMGLKALVVAASVERAIYVRHHPQAEICEVSVVVGIDPQRGQAVVLPYENPPILAPDDGMVWRALRTHGEALLEAVPPGGRLGAPESPESLARRQVVAVPVRYGAGKKTTTIGAILAIDKRASRYSTAGEEITSKETKLAYAVASMIGSVLGTRHAAVLSSELKTAEEIHEQIHAGRPARIPGFDLAGRNRASGTVGGDYFDFLPMRDGRMLVVVADVSGHNLASAMLMVSARMSLHLLVSLHGDLARIFDELGRAIYPDLVRTERFITAAALALTPDGDTAEVVNAGHHDMMLFRAATGRVETVSGGTAVLGLLPEPEHRPEPVRLESGDVVLLYTDGIVEAASAPGEMFGAERLAEVLRAGAGRTAEDILDEVFAAVDRFAHKTAKGDDMTAVVVKSTPRRRPR